MSFEALPPRETAVAACARALRTAILDGEMPAGARLPPERELATRFGVNRVTVRSALGQLEAAGLLAVRQGSGYLVRDFQRDGGPDLLVALGLIAAGNGTLREVAADLLRVRRNLARAVLEAIAESGRPEGIAGFEAAVEGFAALVESGAPIAEVAEADLAVTAALVAATRSPVLQLCLNPVLAVVRGLPAFRDLIYRRPADNVVGWRLLAAWAATRDAALIDTIVAEIRRRDDETLASLTRSLS